MKTHKKLTLHPVCFTTSILTVALSVVIQNESNSVALRGISMLAFTLGVLSLYNENRLKKSFQKSFHGLSNLFGSFWSERNPLPNVESADLLNLDQTNNPRLCKP